jgi:hypothetical protein
MTVDGSSRATPRRSRTRTLVSVSPSERRTAVPDDVATPIDPLVDGIGEETTARTSATRRRRTSRNGSSTDAVPTDGAATVDPHPAVREAHTVEPAADRESTGRDEPRPDEGPVELPTIVPATIDLPVAPTVARAPIDDGAGHDPDEWIEMGQDQIVRVPAEARAVLRPQGRRPRVRKVTRVLRHVDPWSTFKVAVLFSLVLYGVLLTAGVLLWNVALTTGTVDNVERWFTQFGWETFELDGGEIFSNAWKAGIFGMVGLTGFAVLVATLFNLVSDIVGGVRMTVLEEEVVERTVTSTRRFVVHRTPTDPTWSPDAGTPPPP